MDESALPAFISKAAAPRQHARARRQAPAADSREAGKWLRRHCKTGPRPMRFGHDSRAIPEIVAAAGEAYVRR
jgi:hypothetical protein